MNNSLEYEPVICIQGPHKGRIGYFDDTTHDCSLCNNDCCSRDCKFNNDCDNCPQKKEHGECPEFAVIYFGDMLLCSTYHIIPIAYCADKIPMKDFINRIESLKEAICCIKEGRKKSELLLELEYAKTEFYERHILSNFSNKKGKRLFISHSSKDKAFANCLYADLVEQGHNPWLDERDIKPGLSIPGEIQKALKEADYVLLLLSPNSIRSNWVTAEWEAVYWDEVNNQKIKLIPLLLASCDIPKFLLTKKYIDFRDNYEQNLYYLLNSL